MKYPLSSLGAKLLNKRKLMLILFSAFAFFLFSCFVAYQNLSEISRLENQLSVLEKKACQTLEKRRTKDEFLENHILADPYFIDKHIESISLIKNEISVLEALSNHPGYKNSKLAYKRLQELEKIPSMQFSEDKREVSSKIQETDEKQKSTVYMNLDDLEMLLSRIEGVSIGKHTPLEKQPQLIIQNFHLRKAHFFDKGEVFAVKMNLMKREFLKPKQER